MSNEWNLLCRTCDHVHDLDWNHGGDKIQQLIPLLPGLVGTGPALNFLSSWRGDFDVLQLGGLVDFAEQHSGHDLIAVDEYGREHDHCGRQYRCRCCGQQPQCRKPHGHEDDCGPSQVAKGVPDA